MSVFAAALRVYQQGRSLVDFTRATAEWDDPLQWLREDLSEAALDLKLAVIDGDRDRTAVYLDECRELITAIWVRLYELGENEG